MNTYERVTFDDGERSKTVILRNPRIGSFLSGIEVDREGVEVAPRGVDERLRIIDWDLVKMRTPLVMDKHYGELVEAPTQVNVPDQPHW